MLEIRRMTAADVPAVAALEKACFRVPWSAQSFQEEMKNDIAVYFTAWVDGVLAGYCGFWQVADEGHITNVAVLARFRRRGVGSRLVSEMERYARAGGLTLMTLEVRKSNRAAIGLYEKYGFSVLGERKNYYREPVENALIMTAFFSGESTDREKKWIH